MFSRIVDLSVPLRNSTQDDFGGRGPRIEYTDHKQGAASLIAAFPGLTREKLPGGDGWAVETVTLSTHNGTHLDAPYHFHSTMDGGKRSITIDEVPLDWCFRPGVKLDFRHFEDGYVATAADVAAELERIQHRLQPLDIVIVNTAAAWAARRRSICSSRASG
jgi:kynurenine formamidase